MIYRKLLLSLVGISATTYGFFRGVHSYEYDTIKHKKTFFYNESCFYGLIGAVLFGTPVVVIQIPKELYRLEVNLRNLEDEKKTDYYNNL